MNLRSGKQLFKSKMSHSDTNTSAYAHTHIFTQNVDVIPVNATTQSATVLSPVDRPLLMVQ